MAETKELIAEIGLDNVGFVLDSWHWYTAHESVDDLRTLSNQDVANSRAVTGVGVSHKEQVCGLSTERFGFVVLFILRRG